VALDPQAEAYARTRLQQLVNRGAIAGMPAPGEGGYAAAWRGLSGGVPGLAAGMGMNPLAYLRGANNLVAPGTRNVGQAGPPTAGPVPARGGPPAGAVLGRPTVGALPPGALMGGPPRQAPLPPGALQQGGAPAGGGAMQDAVTQAILDLLRRASAPPARAV
jgi:hypothetical protein